MEESLCKAEQALEELLSNFPSKLLGCALRVLVLPLGRRHKGPSDELDAQMAAITGRNSGDPALEELLEGCYRPQAEQDPVGALQYAMDLLSSVQDVQKKLHKALKAGQLEEQPEKNLIDNAVAAGVLTSEEAHSLHQAEAARRVVIDVDDFAKDELTLSPGKVR
jgi:acyl-CoA dehydrogenase